jgi:hypothetical protein
MPGPCHKKLNISPYKADKTLTLADLSVFGESKQKSENICTFKNILDVYLCKKENNKM